MLATLLLDPARAAAQPAGLTFPTTPRASATLTASAAQPPAIGVQFVYVALDGGGVAAYRPTDATQVWRVELTADRPLGLAGPLLLVPAGATLHALDAATGKARWTAPAASLHAPLTSAGDLVIASRGDALVALRAADGGVVWTQVSPPLAERATVEGGRVFTPRADGEVAAHDVADGREIWARPVGGTPGGILVDAAAGRLYVGSADRYLYCLDARDGRIIWRFRIGALLSGPPAADERRVYAAALDNALRAFDRGDGARTWNKGLAYRPTTGPWVVAGQVVVPGTGRELPVFDAASGATAGRVALPERLSVPPGIGRLADGHWIMAAVSGSIATGWTLAIFDSSLAVPIIPLSALPGETIPPPAFAK